MMPAYLLNTKLNKLQVMNQNKNSKVRIHALFHRLQINKNIKFQTRIQWKRHQNKVQTRLVNHEHGFSIFEQTLTLDLNLTFNESKGLYDDKNTEILAIIMYDGKVKSGGYAKYNISQVINEKLESKLLSIPLTQCPDPNANVEVTFTYEQIDQELSEVASMLNASSRDLNMSRVDFHDDKISLQMDRINTTISKLGQLAKNIKEKEKSSADKLPELMKQNEQLKGQKYILTQTIQKLEEKLQSKELEQLEKSKKDKKTIIQLEKQLQKKDKNVKERQFTEAEAEKSYKVELSKKQKQFQKYKKLYQQSQSELQQLKTKEMRGSLGFGNMDVNDVHEIAKFQSENSEQITALKNQNSQLQIKVATQSFRIAQLFNAAFELGGGKLLDQLQKAIGLTQR